MVDYHVHTGEPFLDQKIPHATGSWEDYFKTGRKLGIIPGNSNHPPHYFGKDGKNLHSYENSSFIRGDKYWEYFLEKNIEVRETRKNAFLGMEIDFFSDIKEEKLLEAIETGYLNFKKNPPRKLLKKLENHPLNYIIISTHFLFGKPFDVSIEEYLQMKKLAGGSVKRVIEEYWDTILSSIIFGQAVKQKTSTKKIIMGHIDLIKIIELFEKKLGNTKQIDFYSSFEKTIDQILENIKNSGLNLEINTAGLRKQTGIMPDKFILNKAKKLDIPLTFGSDSHSPYPDDFQKTLLLFKEFVVS